MSVCVCGWMVVCVSVCVCVKTPSKLGCKVPGVNHCVSQTPGTKCQKSNLVKIEISFAITAMGNIILTWNLHSYNKYVFGNGKRGQRSLG